ncbi:glycosyltransferase family 4 protein [Phosphitispora sp. TUW77]|uniref:glycosyltransferase family 4 protein n=1 Tax=Phosphitispora sp. TUW77 TaxID=3152361 RepID=UPI003AB1A810
MIQKIAENTSTNVNIDIFSRGYRSQLQEENLGRIRYHRFPAGPEYFRQIRSKVTAEKYHIIQVENRPLFIPKTKAANPDSKVICSLHSLVHINSQLIRPGGVLKIFQQCEKILVYSIFMKNQLKQMYPAAANKISSIHLGTDPIQFRPRWEPDIIKKTQNLKNILKIPKDYKVILFAGRLIPKKGPDVLVRSMEYILKKYPQCFLVIVGGSWFANKRESPYIKELRQLAGSISGNIRFTNYVSQAELPICFAAADVFVCPSQWDEPFGLVNVEAMASGVPVVASSRGGIPEIVKNGETGFLVPNEKKPASFVEPILDLLKSTRLAQNLGINGRQAVESYFNWQRAGSELSRLYKSILCQS